MTQKFKESLSFLKQKGIQSAEVAIILGTGLGKMVDEIEIEKSISYEEIPHFPRATVEFHQGKLIFGHLNGKKVIIMQGRFHLYEGYSFDEICYPIRIFKLLGVQNLFISNAAGAINLDYNKGNLMLIEDHINLQGGSPLAGKNLDFLGDRFTDMSAPYDLHLNDKIKEIAKAHQIPLYEGTYAAVVGPQLETRAEYRYLNIIGADAVGMSTVPEVIVANHMNLPCVALSILTDECDPKKLKKINIKEIMELVENTEPKLITLFTELIKNI